MPPFRRNGPIRSNLRLSGGTTAPPSAAKGPTTGLNRSRPARPAPKMGIGKNKPAPSGLGASPQPGAAKPVQQPAPLPWDAAAANQVNASQKSLGNAEANLSSQWSQRQQYYGLDGPWADYKTNPYSQAALLQRSYDIANRSAITGSGRQLYAGSQVNARNFNTRQYSEGRNDLRLASQGDYLQFQQGLQAARDKHREAVAESEWNRVNAGLEAGPEPAPAPAKGGGKKKGGKKKGKGGKGKPKRPKIRAHVGRGRKAR